MKCTRQNKNAFSLVCSFVSHFYALLQQGKHIVIPSSVMFILLSPQFSNFVLLLISLFLHSYISPKHQAQLADNFFTFFFHALLFYTIQTHITNKNSLHVLETYKIEKKNVKRKNMKTQEAKRKKNILFPSATQNWSSLCTIYICVFECVVYTHFFLTRTIIIIVIIICRRTDCVLGWWTHDVMTKRSTEAKRRRVKKTIIKMRSGNEI
jgi:hypothetical protein